MSNLFSHDDNTDIIRSWHPSKSTPTIPPHVQYTPNAILFGLYFVRWISHIKMLSFIISFSLSSLSYMCGCCSHGKPLDQAKYLCDFESPSIITCTACKICGSGLFSLSWIGNVCIYVLHLFGRGNVQQYKSQNMRSDPLHQIWITANLNLQSLGRWTYSINICQDE